MDFFLDWFRRHFADRQLVILIIVMVTLTVVIYFAGDILGPVFGAVIIAYLLQGAINRLEEHSVPPRVAFWTIILLATTGFVIAVFGLFPLLFREVAELVQQVPSMATKARQLLAQLPNEYPDLITHEQVDQFSGSLSAEALRVGQTLLTYSITSAVTALTLLVYLILVPFMVFFMVKDKDIIVGWLLGFLPSERDLTNQVWRDINDLIDRYIQGKVGEILIVGTVTYVTFLVLDLDYALLLAAITGFSVLIPYIGATVVTIPVAFVAFYQFGWSAELGYVVTAYLVIQALDGNLLVPLLFGEAVNLHPVAIIIAVLFFGGLWGFWGVFFAIPLATVIGAVISAWPNLDEVEAAPAPGEEHSET